MCIYVVTNKTNGKRYVGLTRLGIAERWRQHVYCSRRKRPTAALHRAIVRYGESAFSITSVLSVLDIAYLAEAERTVIRELRPEYNQTCGGEVTTGRKYGAAALEKIREKNTGKKRTAEQIAANSERRKAWCASHPEEMAVCAETLRVARSKVDQEKRIVAVKRARTGVSLSAEHKNKVSLGHIGIRHSANVCARIAAKKRLPVVCQNTGIVYSDAAAAAKACGVGHRSVIRVLKGTYKAVKGLSFSYHKGAV